MRCTSPRTVGFLADGKTISWSPKHYSKEFASFQLPCGKCLECRLEYARSWAVRCLHESKMYENNMFLTLTYNEESLKSDKLQYIDFQLFVKRLRHRIFKDFIDSYGKENWKLLSKQERKAIYEPYQISIFVTGEYGEKTKRPHWHALIFNYRPNDSLYKYSNDRGDEVYTSKILEQLWPNGNSEFGNVTFESAGYCARYAAKKLAHGNDDSHEYHPISKKSSRHAIGKKWLEKYWPDVFNHGHIVLPNGTTTSIPRYYEKWLKNNKPEEWIKYVTKTKNDKIAKATKHNEAEQRKYNEDSFARGYQKKPLTTRTHARKTILKQKFNQLQKNLKF